MANDIRKDGRNKRMGRHRPVRSREPNTKGDLLLAKNHDQFVRKFKDNTPPKTKFYHFGGKSLLPINLKSKTNKTGLDMNKDQFVRKSKAKPPPKTKFYHFGGKSLLPINLKSKTNKTGLDMNKVRNLRLILI
uniref:Uncharacterized protein n=1 Tax=Salix viminalis TaxID=40686 RepID=A0A6N2K6X1_SALVM